MAVVDSEVTADVNPLAGLEGCSAGARAELQAAMKAALSLAVEVLKIGVKSI